VQQNKRNPSILHLLVPSHVVEKCLCRERFFKPVKTGGHLKGAKVTVEASEIFFWRVAKLYRKSHRQMQPDGNGFPMKDTTVVTEFSLNAWPKV